MKLGSRHTRASRPPSSVLALVVIAFVLSACQGQPLPNAARRGATIALAFGGSAAVSSTAPVWDPSEVVGYGGSALPDNQRGEMVYRLGGPAGNRLDTRLTITVQGHPASAQARSGDSLWAESGFQHVSFVDIPDDALDYPDGSHFLHVSREVNGSEIPIGMLNSPIEILPGTATPSTRFAHWLCPLPNCPPTPVLNDVFAPDLAGLVPSPQVEVQISAVVWALELDFTLPASKVTIRDAVALRPHRISPTGHQDRLAPIVLFTADQGDATVSVAAQGRPFDTASLVFDLQGTVPVDESEVTVSVVAAYDQNGGRITPDPVVTSKRIY